MYDNYNFPIGADTPDAPWNQEENPEKTFNVEVEVVLKKTVSVETNMYNRYFEDETKDYVIDTEDTNWKDAYELSHHTIPELLQMLKTYVEKDMKNFKGIKRRQLALQKILDDIGGWKVDEESYNEV